MEIDELKRMTEQLDEYDRERDVLMREIQFRVKDTLQLVSSLLAMLAKNAGAEAAEDLTSAMLRIQGISAIYAEMCETTNLVEISPRNVAEKLVSDSLQVHARRDLDVAFVYDIDDTALPIHIAMPVAQILCELLSSAMKHAFTGRNRGTIRITIDKIGIKVSDDGIDRDDHPDRIGMHIITILAKQLGGTVKVTYENGTTVMIHLDLYKQNQ